MIGRIGQWISQRDDVQAVMTVLQERRRMPYPESMELSMQDPRGRTFTGLILWNCGTLLQDYKKPFAISTVLVVISLILMLYHWIATW